MSEDTTIKIVGRKQLEGEVRISSSKNAAVALIPATVMGSDIITLYDVPHISDIAALKELLAELNIKVERKGDALIVDPREIRNTVLESEAVGKLRASYYFMGALLGRYKKVKMKMPGGCDLGPRPIDLHLKGFRALGAQINYVDGFYTIEAPELVGADIYLDFASVGATINIMLAASMAEGKTVIENAAREPHVVDVAQFLNQMGADVRGAGTDRIRINGVKKFKAADHEIIPDQIEAGTFMCAAAATRGDVTLTHVIPQHLESISEKLRNMGAQIEEKDDEIRVVATSRLQPTSLRTMPHPGFPTDMQSQFTVCLALADGSSLVTEEIFENRLNYTAELIKMGANITTVKGTTAIIQGVERLTGAIVKAHDLRAGAAMVIAGLAAEGCTCIEDIHYIKRGYEDFAGKIRQLGGVIKEQEVENHEDQERKMRKMEMAG